MEENENSNSRCEVQPSAREREQNVNLQHDVEDSAEKNGNEEEEPIWRKMSENKKKMRFQAQQQ